jgi:acyl carrier protein
VHSLDRVELLTAFENAFNAGTSSGNAKRARNFRTRQGGSDHINKHRKGGN